MNVFEFEEFEIDPSKKFFIIYGKTEGDLEESDQTILSSCSTFDDVFLFRSLAASAISIANSIIPGEGEILIEIVGLESVISTRSSSTISTSDNQLIKRIVEAYKLLNKRNIRSLNVYNY